MRPVHLVGSVPLRDAREVFTTVSGVLGQRLKRIPDGETGERSDWITWLEPAFADNPSLEKSDELFRVHATGTARIRYKLRAGKTAVSAVVTSFSRVFITLVDTHLAALISAVFLFLFGTGPVKGFAVTLVIGLISNMFTAVFVSRTLFEWVLNRKQRAEIALSI